MPVKLSETDGSAAVAVRGRDVATINEAFGEKGAEMSTEHKNLYGSRVGRRILDCAASPG